MKLGYEVNKDNNTHIFCSKKSKLMLVIMATPISSHVKDKNSIFTAHDEDDDLLVKGKILVFQQYLHNKIKNVSSQVLARALTNNQICLVVKTIIKSSMG